jgi:predicted nucleotidyltransferase
MELLEAIKRPEMRRIFGERELEIIEKQVLGIRLTPSERTRLSRDIKKKFLAMQLLSQYSIDLLKAGSEIKRRVSGIKDEIMESKYFPNIKKIILYGSSAYGIRTFRSDIDIAVEFDKISSKEASEFVINFNYHDKIQIEVYNILPDKIKEEIDKKGKVLYARKN